MPRKPSAETELRTARRIIREQQVTITRAERERDAYRARATKAEQECAEWKSRFDQLLARGDSPKYAPICGATSESTAGKMICRQLAGHMGCHLFEPMAQPPMCQPYETPA